MAQQENPPPGRWITPFYFVLLGSGHHEDKIISMGHALIDLYRFMLTEIQSPRGRQARDGLLRRSADNGGKTRRADREPGGQVVAKLRSCQGTPADAAGTDDHDTRKHQSPLISSYIVGDIRCVIKNHRRRQNKGDEAIPSGQAGVVHIDDIPGLKLELISQHQGHRILG